MEKKAQTALEYLMTYGWAILIIIIVGAALYALGVFSPGTFTGKRSTGFSAFQMNDFKFSSNDLINLSFGNRAGKTVNLTGVNATFKGQVCAFNSSAPGAANSTYLPNAAVGPNVVYWITMNCSNFQTQSNKTSYSVAIDFYYIDPDSGFGHDDSGTIFGIVE